jgi:hypothetical protein
MYQTTEINVFSSNPKVLGHSPQNFMIIGHIEKYENSFKYHQL